MRRLFRLLTATLLCTALQHAWAVQPGVPFANAKLAAIAATASPELQTPTVNGDFKAGHYAGYPLVGRVVDQQIVHLGIGIFDAAYKADADALLCNFAERYLLELLLLPDEQSRMKKMYDDGVAIFGQLERIPLSGREQLRFNIRLNDANRCLLEWYDGQKLLFSLSAPTQYELLTGMDKTELENSFRNSVLRYIRPAVTAAQPTAPEATTEGLYVVRRGHYLLERMQSALYYHKRGDNFELIRDTRYPAESLGNLLCTDASDNRYTARVTLNKYGFQSETFECSLTQLIGFCLREGCKPYFGIETIEGDVITATLILVNSTLGYNHLLKVVFDAGLLGRTKGHIDVTLHAYTPTHNLADIYDDEHQMRRKNNPQKIKL